MMDSTYINKRRTASTCARKDKDRKFGISKGGKTTKIHVLRNEEGMPFEYIITGGKIHNGRAALDLLGKHPIKGLILIRHMAQMKRATNWNEEILKYVSPRIQTANAPGHMMKDYTRKAIKLKIYLQTERSKRHGTPYA